MAHKNKSNYSPYKARQEERQIQPGGHAELKGKHVRPEKIFSIEEANDRLLDIFKNHDFLDMSHAERRQLANFYVVLMQTQEHNNFTRLLKIKDIAIKHFIDSLIIKRYTKLQFPLIDIGTGPGFPGIPLKIAFPNERIVLAEGVQKRVEFLKQVREQLNLPNLDIMGRNINKYTYYPGLGAITRAVEDIRNTLENSQNCLLLGGKVYFMKGPGVDPEIEMAKDNQFFKLVQDVAYDLPKTPHHRRLLVYEKVKETPWVDEDDFHLFSDELSSEEKRKWSHYL